MIYILKLKVRIKELMVENVTNNSNTNYNLKYQN